MRRERRKVDSARVRHVAHGANAFFVSFPRGVSLTACEMVHRRAELQENANERHLVSHGFEVELLEELGCLEPVASRGVAERLRKARIVFDRWEHPLHSTTVLRAAAIVVLLVINLLFWGTPVFLGGVIKLLTFGELRRRVNRTLPWFGEQWVRFNGRIFDAFLTTSWDLEGFDELRRDGRYLIISNHVSWIDIFALFRAFHGKAPFIRFFLKQVLIWFPVAGQACWALSFPFMRRYSPDYLALHPEKRGRDLETTRRACRLYRHIPVAILNFVEGTRLTRQKQEDQQSPYVYLLRPRVGGVAFVLASLGEQLDAVIDVTLVYPRTDVTMWDFITNRVSRIVIRARRLRIPAEFSTPAATEPGPARERFKTWIDGIWREKDRLIASIYETFR